MTAIRFIYIPTAKSGLNSFAVPLQNFEDIKLSDQWFAGNAVVSGSCRSVQDEGLGKEWGHLSFTFVPKSKG
jgi:hypothetical protein